MESESESNLSKESSADLSLTGIGLITDTINDEEPRQQQSQEPVASQSDFDRLFSMFAVNNFPEIQQTVSITDAICVGNLFSLLAMPVAYLICNYMKIQRPPHLASILPFFGTNDLANRAFLQFLNIHQIPFQAYSGALNLTTVHHSPQLRDEQPSKVSEEDLPEDLSMKKKKKRNNPPTGLDPVIYREKLLKRCLCVYRKPRPANQPYISLEELGWNVDRLQRGQKVLIFVNKWVKQPHWICVPFYDISMDDDGIPRVCYSSDNGKLNWINHRPCKSCVLKTICVKIPPIPSVIFPNIALSPPAITP